MHLLVMVVMILGLMVTSGEAYNCPEYGLDFGGNDINDVPYGIPSVNSWNDCGKDQLLSKTSMEPATISLSLSAGQICQLVSDCRFWSWYGPGRYCYLKYSDNGVRQLNGQYSGAKGCY